MTNRLFAKLFVRFITALLFIVIEGSALKVSAQEPTSWFVGFGGGYGRTQIDRTYSNSAQTGGMNLEWINWSNQSNRHYKSQGIIFEGLVGYKHFLNDYIGFRYYASLSTQFYKDTIFTNNKNKIGIIDYGLNTDLLINFYTNPFLSFGIFGGFSVGGAHFDSPALDDYERFWGGATDSTRYTEAIFDGIGKISKNYFSASLAVGLRINFLQHIRGSGQVVCSASGDGRRTCKKPSSLLEHSLEFSARFPMLSYKATRTPEVIGHYCSRVGGNYIGEYKCANYRYGYEIKNPYKLTLRYIIAF